MSSVVLSAAVRQNLLALQNTASLMASTQNDLATGKKVNSALDNPTNFFTAQSLDNRAGDISNLLDGISNGVQVLQAANTGITSLESLVSQAKSIANQALQTSIGYSTKASVTSAAITGATSTNLLGTGYSAGSYTTAALTQAGSASSTLISATSHLSTTGSATDAVAVTAGTNLIVNGQTISFASGTGASSISATGSTIHVDTGTVGDIVSAINAVAGAGTASINSSGELAISSTSGTGVTIGGTALAALGLDTGGTAAGTQDNTAFTGFAASGSTLAPAGSLVGETLTIPVTNDGSTTTASITFGTGSGQVSTLDELNTALASSNLQATLDSTTGKLTITTTNDAASGTIGTIGGTAQSTSTAVFASPTTVSSPTADATSQTARATLVSQYNAILTQIDYTAADSSYNGVNLLAGDQLQLTFNETGKSKLNITGVNFGSAGLGLAALTNTAFQDNNATNSVLTTLNTASSTLRSEASALGSNLSVVQTRQDFNTNLINVLQTGSANLTQADINLEAANSQALSTRQSLSVSALSLANQSQQSVLQLLR